MAETEYFKVGQKALIEKGGKVLILNDPKRGLDFPGGKVEAGEENLIDSLLREIEEETTLKVTISDPFNVGYWNKTKPTYFVFFKAEYISGDVNLSDEHDNFEWVGKEDLGKLNSNHSFFKVLEKYFEGA